MWTVPSPWNVPYRFRSVEILHHDQLEELIGEKMLTFRVGKRPQIFFGDRVQFEKDCDHRTLTMNEFLRWVQGEDGTTLQEYSRDEYFAYADYMHLPELFGEDKDAAVDRITPYSKMIDWTPMGMKGRNGSQSTLWIGSQGAHTPCHYDTYGINFVAQIRGRKRWLLFPPDSPISRLQTRIPYEESSVYLDTNLSLMRRFAGIDVYDVTLEPGDVLFVPKHWWHFVCSIDPVTISINTWLEQPDDSVERIKEMFVRHIITSMTVAHEHPSDHWFNHNEIITDPSTNLTILASLFEPSDEPHEPAAKRSTADLRLIVPDEKVEEQRLISTTLEHLDFFDQIKSSPSSAAPAPTDDLAVRLVRSMTTRQMIDTMYENFLWK